MRKSSFWSRLVLVVAILLTHTISVHAATTLTIQSPDEGDELVASGVSYEIKWTTSSKVAATFEYFLIPQDDTPVLPPPPPGGSSIAYLEDFGGYNPGGKVVSVAASSHTGTLYLDPEIPEGTYTLRIYAVNGTLRKPSDATFVGESESFTIENIRPTTASVGLITPNGGETWVSGNPQILRFRSSGVATMQLALTNLTTGQPCTIATNITARTKVWMIIPVIGTPCGSSATQRLTAGEYRAALYDNNWAFTRASDYGEEPFTIRATPDASETKTERLTALISLLTEILTALRAAQ
jgi:hypothetical protein